MNKTSKKIKKYLKDLSKNRKNGIKIILKNNNNKNLLENIQFQEFLLYIII